MEKTCLGHAKNVNELVIIRDLAFIPFTSPRVFLGPSLCGGDNKNAIHFYPRGIIFFVIVPCRWVIARAIIIINISSSRASLSWLSRKRRFQNMSSHGMSGSGSLTHIPYLSVSADHLPGLDKKCPDKLFIVVFTGPHKTQKQNVPFILSNGLYEKYFFLSYKAIEWCAMATDTTADQECAMARVYAG